LGLNGESMSFSSKKPEEKLDYDRVFDSTQLAAAIRNLFWMKKQCKGENYDDRDLSRFWGS